MNQDHIILLFMFPELPDEYAIPYTSDELETAKADAKAFVEMYDEALYVAVCYAYADGREEEVFRWSNPNSAKLISRASSAGGVLSGYPTSSDFAMPAGASSPKSNSKSSPSPWGARPPSEAKYEAPLPSTSKTYAGHPRRRTRPYSSGKRR